MKIRRDETNDVQIEIEKGKEEKKNNINRQERKLVCVNKLGNYFTLLYAYVYHQQQTVAISETSPSSALPRASSSHISISSASFPSRNKASSPKNRGKKRIVVCSEKREPKKTEKNPPSPPRPKTLGDMKLYG